MNTNRLNTQHRQQSKIQWRSISVHQFTEKNSWLTPLTRGTTWKLQFPTTLILFWAWAKAKLLYKGPTQEHSREWIRLPGMSYKGHFDH